MCRIFKIFVNQGERIASKSCSFIAIWSATSQKRKESKQNHVIVEHFEVPHILNFLQRRWRNCIKIMQFYSISKCHISKFTFIVGEKLYPNHTVLQHFEVSHFQNFFNHGEKLQPNHTVFEHVKVVHFKNVIQPCWINRNKIR